MDNQIIHYSPELSPQNDSDFHIALFTFDREFGDEIIACGLLCILDCGRNFTTEQIKNTSAHLIYEHLGQKVYVVPPLRYVDNVYLYPRQSHLLQTLKVAVLSKLSSDTAVQFLDKLADQAHFLSFLHQSYAIGDICFSMTYPSVSYSKDVVFGHIIDYAIQNDGISHAQLENLDKIMQLRFDKANLIPTTHKTATGATLYDCSDIILNNLNIKPKYAVNQSNLIYHYKKNRLRHFFDKLENYGELYSSMEVILKEQKKLGVKFQESMTNFILYGFIFCGQPSTAYINSNGLYPIVWGQCTMIYTTNYAILYQPADSDSQQVHENLPVGEVDFAFGVMDDKVNDYTVFANGKSYHNQADVFLVQSANITNKIALVINKDSDKSYTPPTELNFMFRAIDFDNFVLLLGFKDEKHSYKYLDGVASSADKCFRFFENLFLLQIAEHVKNNQQQETEKPMQAQDILTLGDEQVQVTAEPVAQADETTNEQISEQLTDEQPPQEAPQDKPQEAPQEAPQDDEKAGGQFEQSDEQGDSQAGKSGDGALTPSAEPKAKNESENQETDDVKLNEQPEPKDKQETTDEPTNEPKPSDKTPPSADEAKGMEQDFDIDGFLGETVLTFEASEETKEIARKKHNNKPKSQLPTKVKNQKNQLSQAF